MVNIGKGLHKSQAQRHGRTSRICQTALVAALVSPLGQPVFGGDDAKESGTYRPKERSKNAAAETANEDHSAIQQLMLQIEELQSRVRELEEKEPPSVKTLAPTLPSAALPSSPALATAPPVAVKPASPPAEAPQADPSASGPRGVQLRLFGDVGYRATDAKGVSNTFYLGSLDLFMTGNLSDRVSLLSEVLFIPLHDNSIGVDLERLLVQYKQNDFFKFNVGRYHTSIGYYNTAFHQGAWFQTTIGRPFMYEFDDKEGFLPLQEVGFSVSGEVPSERLGLHYVAEVGNGRNHLLNSDPAQNFRDSHNGKSFNFAVFARPSWVSGLQAGFSIYHDHLTFADNLDHSEFISTVHVVYANPTYEFLNEGMLVRHTTAGVRDSRTTGFYTQFSRKFGAYRPYFRYSYVNAPDNDPIYGDPLDGPVVGRRDGPAVGVRWDFTDHSAVKLQYEREGRRGQPTSNGLATEISFAY